jgi:Mn2+/Fe2+ NRAMP family transporter
MQPTEQPSDQKRHIRQAMADMVFGLALFALFVLLGVFGVKQASSSDGQRHEGATQAQTAVQPQEKENSVFPIRLVSPGVQR